MRPFSFAVLALACVGSVPAAAQTGSQANLVLTILGGTVTGHQLWVVDKQPLQVLNSSNYDTLRLSRAMGSGVVIGAAATYFLSPHVGLHAEVAYFGLSLDNSCTGLFFHPDTIEMKNKQVCDDIQAQAQTGATIGISTGVTLRAAPRRSFSPYARGSIGFVHQSRSTIDMVGGFFDAAGTFFERQVILDPKPRHGGAMLGAAVGFTSPLGPGYQFRLELQDAIVPFDRLTGPANPLLVGPVSARWYHHLALKLGLDIVLERQRGRRY